jgi:hypothetical protein
MSKTAPETAINGYGFDAVRCVRAGRGERNRRSGVDAMSSPRSDEMRRLGGPSQPHGGRYAPEPQALRRRGRLSRCRTSLQEGSLCAY